MTGACSPSFLPGKVPGPLGSRGGGREKRVDRCRCLQVLRSPHLLPRPGAGSRPPAKTACAPFLDPSVHWVGAPFPSLPFRPSASASASASANAMHEKRIAEEDGRHSSSTTCKNQLSGGIPGFHQEPPPLLNNTTKKAAQTPSPQGPPGPVSPITHQPSRTRHHA